MLYPPLKHRRGCYQRPAGIGNEERPKLPMQREMDVFPLLWKPRAHDEVLQAVEVSAEKGPFLAVGTVPVDVKYRCHGIDSAYGRLNGGISALARLLKGDDGDFGGAYVQARGRGEPCRSVLANIMEGLLGASWLGVSILCRKLSETDR